MTGDRRYSMQLHRYVLVENLRSHTACKSRTEVSSDFENQREILTADQDQGAGPLEDDKFITSGAVG